MSEAGKGRASTPPRGYEPSDFRPAWWLPGPHLQTLGGKYLRTHPDRFRKRIRIETADGDFLDLDVGPDPHPRSPVVLVLHGLEGSSRRGYVRSAVAHLSDAGMHPVAMNLRGCSGEPNRLPRFYHSGETGDVARVIDALDARYPGRSLAAVGYSLGGNILLKYLGETGDRCRLAAAASVSVPFDLAAGCRTIESGPWGRLYTRYFLGMLRDKIRAKRPLLESVIDVEAALAAPTLWRFDDLATAPLHGFRDAGHYYAEASSNQFLERIQVPTLLVQARNDPFLAGEHIPEEAVKANPNLAGAFTAGGGHVGFVAGRPWAPRFWSEEEVARFLSARTRGDTPELAGP